MPRSHFDAIVVGLGAMGGAVAAGLARRGLSVLGLDRYRPPHLLGSSHGGSRIIRAAYHESPIYVPLVRRARREWAALEERTGTRLWSQCGGLMIGPPDGSLVSGALASVREHGLPHDEWSASEVRRRFPAFELPDSLVGVWDPHAGILHPEAAVEAQLGEAVAAGAVLRFEEPVRGWRSAGEGYLVSTPGREHGGSALVLACGPWLGELAGDVSLPLQVERVVQHWFGPRSGREPLGADALPVFLCEFEPDRMFYGFPDTGAGVKIGLHYQGEPTGADAVKREVGSAELLPVRKLLARYLPDANGPHLRSEVCMYTNTPDLHFLIDRHPRHERVWLVSPCSGHGFKFAPVIGELIADRIAGRRPDFDLAPFGLARFGSAVDV